MMVPLLLVIPGVIAARLVPGLTSKDFAYPSLVARSLPWPVVGLFCAALFGSIISTYNSFLNAASTVFMIDIYKPIFNPNLSEEATVNLQRKLDGALQHLPLSLHHSLMCLAQDFMISDEALQVL